MWVLLCNMKLFQHIRGGLVAGIAVFAVSSCAYDGYSTGASYSSGFGDGYGYGNSSFSTSVFVGTGNPRWGYDPYAGAYFDYTRRAYYDPYLYGYYPVGYRPRYVIGAPHPRGWRRGNQFCPPPQRIRNYRLRNFRDRGERYQGLGRDWSRNVRVRDQREQNRRDFRRDVREERRNDRATQGRSFERSLEDRQRRLERTESRRGNENFERRQQWRAERQQNLSVNTEGGMQRQQKEP